MRIGLIDIDYNGSFPNIPLMKLSAWHKQIGNTVEWYDPISGHFDIVYVSKVFSWSPDYQYPIDADKIIKGGSGYWIENFNGKETWYGDKAPSNTFLYPGKYQEYLDNERGYDFADMINIAAQNVRELPGCASGYRYILLDEVQDLSRNRQELVLAILQKNPSCKLFAVGDDWQSIYRFTGSNLELIRNFEKVFQRPVRRSLIESTHRFALPTLKISSEFVQKNPLQARKHVRSSKDSQTPIEIIFNEPDEAIRGSDVPAFERAISHLIKEFGFDVLQTKELQVISCYNHDLKRLAGVSNIQIDGVTICWHNPQDMSQKLRFEFCSMHKSKGITRDIVLVLNMNSDLMGMPAQRETDPIIDALLSQEESFPFAEERRLFYVAITRARERTILLANRKNPSPFLFEICSELAQEENSLCPKCETGELLRKKTKRGAFSYCSNFRYGCDYFRRL